MQITARETAKGHTMMFKKNRLLKCHYNFRLLLCSGEANDLAAAPDKTTEGVCGLMRTYNIPRSSAKKQTT